SGRALSPLRALRDGHGQARLRDVCRRSARPRQERGPPRPRRLLEPVDGRHRGVRGARQGLAEGEVVPVGHSFGAAALLSTVLARKLTETRRFVLSSPALRLKTTIPGWKLALG